MMRLWNTESLQINIASNKIRITASEEKYLWKLNYMLANSHTVHTVQCNGGSDSRLRSLTFLLELTKLGERTSACGL